MSDNYGFDFNNDGKVSFEESHLTYHIERETARSNSLSDSLKKSSVNRDIRDLRDSSHDTENKDTSEGSGGGEFGIFLLFLLVFGFIVICVKIATGG